MSILINKNTKVITQGITGKTGQFHTRMCRDYANGTQLLRRRREPEEGRRGFRRHPDLRHACKEAKAADRRHRLGDLRAAGRRRRGDREAVDADLDLVICITEGIPVRDMMRTRRPQGAGQAARRCCSARTAPALITPDEIKIGIMPGHIHRKGRIGVVIALGHADLRGGRRS